jgi:hypothetical protein
MSNDNVKRFLKIIKQIESSGGKNFKHNTMKSGIHKGSSGIGNYGLMPNTVSEVLTRIRRSGKITPELAELQKLNPSEFKSHLEANPNQEEQIAEALAELVLARQQDEEKAAFSWNQGHNLTPDKVEKSDYKNADYVKKFNQYKNEQPTQTLIAGTPLVEEDESTNIKNTIRNITGLK